MHSSKMCVRSIAKTIICQREKARERDCMYEKVIIFTNNNNNNNNYNNDQLIGY